MKIKLYQKGNTLTGVLPLALSDGRTLLIKASVSLTQTRRELGFDDIDDDDEVGWNLFKSIGGFVKKVAKSKVFKAIGKVAKKMIKNPLVTGALGVITGGAAVPALAAANIAMNVIDAAKGGGKKGTKARKLLKASVKAAGKKSPKALPSPKAKALAAKAFAKQPMTPHMLGKLGVAQMTAKLAQKKGVAITTAQVLKGKLPAAIQAAKAARATAARATKGSAAAKVTTSILPAKSATMPAAVKAAMLARSARGASIPTAVKAAMLAKRGAKGGLSAPVKTTVLARKGKHGVTKKRGLISMSDKDAMEQKVNAMSPSARARRFLVQIQTL